MNTCTKFTLLILGLCLLLLTNTAYAQTTNYTIKGQVVDSAFNETIPYATIIITGQKDIKTVLKVVASDANGKFETKMSKGEYILSVQYMGKSSYEKKLNLGTETIVDLGRVSISSDTELGEVTVVAQKPLVKVDLDKIIYSLESDPESITSNVLDMLRKVPLVTVDGEDEIELKGNKNFKIYLDGKPSAMIDSNPKDVLKSMPAGSIKDIEIITDPGAKYDAEGVSGIINIITNKNSNLGGYTVNINANANTGKSYGAGAHLTLKYGEIGFTGNFNYYGYNPTGQPSGSEQENFSYVDKEGNTVPIIFRYMEGYSKNKGSGFFGGGQLSYEIDTLNLIQVGFNKYGGEGKYNSTNSTYREDIDNNLLSEYNSLNNGKYKYGTNTLTADYQRTFSNQKDRLLTLSYRLDLSPSANYNKNYSEDEDIFNYFDRRTEQISDGSSYEHTAQIDFTTPIAKIHTVETGFKFINRVNKGDNNRKDWDFDDNTWKDIPSVNDVFRNQQNILSAYAGYSLKTGNWGFKTGVRYEGTWMKSEFAMNEKLNYKKDYSNFVPSATVSYQLNPGQTLRVGYNMSIRRPGIWHLNPYVNTSDSLNISYGNPYLDAVKFHSTNLNYTFFNPKFNMNINLSYSFANNEIERISENVEGVIHNTYDNIGKNKNFYASFYGNWSPSQKFRIFGNLGMSYYKYQNSEATNSKQKTDGIRPQMSGGVQFTFPKKLIVSANGGYYGAWRSLERKGNYFYYYNFSVSKSFLKDKLTVRAMANNPFENSRTMRSKVETLTYRSENWNLRRVRNFGISVSFRFGELKERISTTRRGISNTDQMGGGQGGGEGGGGN